MNHLFSEEERPVLSSYSLISGIVNPSFKLIKSFKRIVQYYDEPKFWQYSANLNSKFANQDGNDFESVASGVSFASEKLAIIKCLCESVERYCNHAFFDSSTSCVSNYKDLKVNALNPRNVVAFSNDQLKSKKFSKFLIHGNSKFSWTEGISLLSDEKVFIPSQLIYLSYPYVSGEPVIYPGISTGAAGGSCLSAALVRGICEIVERNAFMIFYLNKIETNKIAIDQIKDSRILNLLNTLNRYKLEVSVFDITTDIGLPTFLTVVVDRTGFGKAISLGLKCDLDSISAIVGSLEEVFNSRTWLRGEYEKSNKKIIQSDLLKNSDIRTRGLLWYPMDTIANLEFLLNSPTSKLNVAKKNTPKTSGRQLAYILDLFKSHEYDILYKDITVPIFKKMNYFVVKTIIPQMQQFYLDENYKLLGGSRLREVPKKMNLKTKLKMNQFNLFPHPFL